MTDPRDELAAIIARVTEEYYHHCSDDHSSATVDAILAAGYRKVYDLDDVITELGIDDP